MKLTQPNLVFSTLAAVALALLPLFMHGCSSTSGAGITVASANAALEDLYDSPVASFDKSCARCHGPHGAQYGDSLAKMDEQRLENNVRDMMSGPAQLMPTETEVAAMIGYHRALREKRPFATVNNAASFLNGSDLELKGDTVPGAKITLDKDGEFIEATTHGFRWSVNAPPRPPFFVIAEKGGNEMRFLFPEQQWTVMN